MFTVFDKSLQHEIKRAYWRRYGFWNCRRSEGQPFRPHLRFTQEMLDAYGDKVMGRKSLSANKFAQHAFLPSTSIIFWTTWYDTGMIEAYQVQSTGISNYQLEPFLKFQQIILPKDELMQSFHDKAILMQKQIADSEDNKIPNSAKSESCCRDWLVASWRWRRMEYLWTKTKLI